MSGPFGSSSFNHLVSTGFYNGVATQSLRFDDGSTAYLSRTFSGAPDNDKKMTISVWVKRGIISNATQVIIGNYDTTRFLGELSFRSDDKIVFRPGGQGDGASNSYSVQTTAQFRDTHSWYHLVLAYDSTQGTAANRVELYVNGTEQYLEPLTVNHSFPPENYGHDFSYNGANNAIGYYPGGFDSNYLDGYLAEFNFIDGLTLDPTSFGESKNGVWIAIEYTGSYGTNGYRLQFKNTGTGTASASTIGADTSGNNHHWTSSGIAASDCAMDDSPENNFATATDLDGKSITLSEGNLRFTTGNSTNPVLGNFEIPLSGKWYWEVYVVTVSDMMIGVQNRLDFQTNGYSGRKTTYYRQGGSGGGSGSIYIEGSGNGGDQAAYTNGDVVAVLYNADDMKIAWRKNGTQQGLTFDVTDTDVVPIIYQASGSGTNTGIFNFGQDSTFAGAETAGGNSDANGNGDFAYAPPSGYLALCSASLPEPTIGPNSSILTGEVHNSVVYTGTGSSQAITGVGFQPDFVWIKKYANSTARNHILTDSTRGVTKHLSTALTDAEFTNTNGLTAFGTDGFTVGSYDSVNENTGSYIAWNWRANGGTTTVDESGTIDGTVQVNTTAGFSIVKYTGNATAGATVGHGLGVAPDTIWIHRLSNTGDWIVFHHKNTSAPATDLLKWNTTGATIDANTVFNDTAPTSSVFSLGNSVDVNENSNLYIAYCFKEIEGYSKFGAFEGNASTDGSFVFLGFRPRLVIAKCIDNTSAWHMFDPNLDSNPVGYLNANSADHYQDYNHYDILSNGFKIRDNGTESNRAATFVYLAWAEMPFKYANAR